MVLKTRIDTRIYNRNYMRRTRLDKLRTRNANRIYAMAQLNSKCLVCGNTDIRVLQFDHIDPKTKNTNISTLFNRKNRVVLDMELTKCQLLCANCHAIKTHEEGSLRQGRMLVA